MSLLFFYDFETTGLPDFAAPSDAEHQPHIVQAAAALVDAETRKTIASLDLISCPDGWEIPEEVAKVHGITTEHARRVGIAEEAIVHAMFRMWRQADLRVAHNQQFDARIMRIALKRFGFGIEQAADMWKAGNAACTARLATPILKLPPTERMVAAGRNHHKTANLSEAYWHFTGRKLENAHTAMADVQACMAVWFAIEDGVNGAAAERAAANMPPPVAPAEAAEIPFLS